MAIGIEVKQKVKTEVKKEIKQEHGDEGELLFQVPRSWGRASRQGAGSAAGTGKGKGKEEEEQKKKKKKKRGRPPKNRRLWPKAKSFARVLGLKSNVEWHTWRNTSARPGEIPSRPDLVYTDWTDWTECGNFVADAKPHHHVRVTWARATGSQRSNTPLTAKTHSPLHTSHLTLTSLHLPHRAPVSRPGPPASRRHCRKGS